MSRCLDVLDVLERPEQKYLAPPPVNSLIGYREALWVLILTLRWLDS